MSSSAELLGHIFDKYGVHVDEFLGLASYYRRFILGFANISKPLNVKISEKVTFVWTEEMQKSFDASKQKLITAPVLAYPDYQKAFSACTDASNKAVGAVLSQMDDNCK